MFPSQQFRNVECQVVEMHLVQSGSYVSQELRPFNVHINQEDVSHLANSTRDGTSLGVAQVQDVASRIISPQTNAEGLVNISNGWQSRRFRFIMKVKEVNPLMSRTAATYRYFFGYTDHCEASLNYLDPEMRVYFNSETTVKEQMLQTPQGLQPNLVMVGANQIIQPLTMAGQAALLQDNNFLAMDMTHLIRPEDVFATKRNHNLRNVAQNSGFFDGEMGMVFDERSSVGAFGMPQYSRRRDLAPARYLSHSLKSFEHGMKEAQGDEDFTGGIDENSIYDDARAKSANTNIQSNNFFAVLMERTQFFQRGYVTWNELCTAFPETDHIAQYSMDDGRSIRKINHHGDSDHFHREDRSGIAVSLVSQVVPSIMMDNFLLNIGFTVTNGQGPGEFIVNVHPDSVRGLAESSMLINYVNEFIRRLQIDVLAPITQNNELPIEMTVFSQLTGDTVIDMNLNYEGMSRWVAPTFSDSLFTSMATKHDQLQSKIANDLTWLMSQVVPGGTNAVPTGPANAPNGYFQNTPPMDAPAYGQHVDFNHQTQGNPHEQQSTKPSRLL